MNSLAEKAEVKPVKSLRKSQEIAVLFDREAATWTLRIGDGRWGPAGVLFEQVSREILVTADAADPGRLLEVAVVLPGHDPDASPSWPTLRFVERLFGQVPMLAIGSPPPTRSEEREGLLYPEAVGAQWRTGHMLSLLSRQEISGERSLWWGIEVSLLAASVGLYDLARYHARQSCESLSREVRWGARAHSSAHSIRARRRLLDLVHVVSQLDSRSPYLEKLRDLSRQLSRPKGLLARLAHEVEEKGMPSRRSDHNPMPELYRVELQQALVNEIIVAYEEGAHVEWSRYTGCMEVTVHLTGEADPKTVSEHWVRLHRELPGELPYLEHMSELESSEAESGKVAHARLLASVDSDVNELRLDVTRTPDTSPVTESSRARYDAITRGRAATECERLCNWEGAIENWERCAAAWKVYGRRDLAAIATKRAGMAARNVGDPQASARLEQIAHELADELAQPWLFEHLGRFRPYLPPFDGDVLGHP